MKKNAKDWAKTYGAKFLEQGVCKYANETILIKNDAIFRMMHTLKGRPVIILHKDDIKPENMEEHADGYVSAVRYHEFDASFHCDFVVFTDEGNQKIKDGWSVSCAYIPTEWGMGGEWHSVPYDREILNGEFTHLALVPNPRYEDITIYENSKKEKEAMVFKLFQKKEVENQKELQNAVVEISENEEIPLKDLVEAYKNAKKNEADEEKKKEDEEKEKVNMDDEIEVDGEKVKVKDLVNAYKKASKKNESDEDKKDEDEDKKNEDDKEKEKDNSKDNDQTHFFSLKNAAELGNEELQNEKEYDSSMDKVKRGAVRYGSAQKPKVQ